MGDYMFENFLDYFNVSINMMYKEENNELELFLQSFGGKEFGNGIFRVFLKEDISYWEENIARAYQEFDNKFQLFAYDWLGRCFGIDLRKGHTKNILIFEIGTNDVLEIPCDFLEFLNEEIPTYHEECLASRFYKKWIEHYGKCVENKRCIGYKVPLFLGGSDDIQNMEESDMDVYWHIITQIKDKNNICVDDRNEL